MAHHRRISAAFLTTALVLGAVACGDDGESEPAGTSAPAGAQPQADTATSPGTAPATSPATDAPAAADGMLTEPRDATAEVVSLLGAPAPVAERADELARAVAEALVASTSDCEVPATAVVVSVTPGEPTVAVIDHDFGCDDSVGGARYELMIEGDDTSGWGLTSATRQDVCLRGVAGDLCS